MSPAPAGRYVPPLCPGPDPGADWQEMGWCCHDCAATAHLAWCPNHADDADQPVPFTLTPKAHAALDNDHGPVMDCGCGYADCSACAGYGWSCQRCGAAYHGDPPGHGLCPACRKAHP